MTKKLKITDPEVQDELKALAVEITALKLKVKEMYGRIDDSYKFNYRDNSIVEGSGHYDEEVYSVLGDILELLRNAESYVSEKRGLQIGYMSSYIHGRG